MLVSNGTDSACYRVTENYFMSFAYPSLYSVDLDGTETDTAVDGEGEASGSLADTGFDNALLMLLVMVLAGSGVMFLVAARRRD